MSHFEVEFALQLALRRTPSEPHRRASPPTARSTRTRLDLQPACSAQALKEPYLPVQTREYQLTGHGKGYRPRCAQITVCEAFDGSVTLLYKGRRCLTASSAKANRPSPWTMRKASTPPSSRPRLSNSTARLTSLRLTIPGNGESPLSSSRNLMPKRGYFSLEKREHFRIGLTDSRKIASVHVQAVTRGCGHYVSVSQQCAVHAELLDSYDNRLVKP